MADTVHHQSSHLVHNLNRDHNGFHRVGAAMQLSIAHSAQDSSFPAKQGYLISTLRDFMDDEDIPSLDNGIHIMWAARNFNARKPSTFTTDHALGSMDISLPAAMAAKMVHPDR